MNFPINGNGDEAKFEKTPEESAVWQNGDAGHKLIVDEDWRSTESTSSEHEMEEEEDFDETEEVNQVLSVAKFQQFDVLQDQDDSSPPASTASAGTTSTDPEDVNAPPLAPSFGFDKNGHTAFNGSEMNNGHSKLASNIKELLERKSLDPLCMSPARGEPSTIQTGAKFSSFTDFDSAFESWKQINHHPFRVASSETLRMPDGSVNDTFKYRYIVYHCAHYGQPRMRGVGKRPNQNYLPCGCRAMLRLNFNWSENALRITTLNEQHSGHEISADSYAKISTKVRKAPSPTTSPSIRGEDRRSSPNNVIRRPQPQMATGAIKCEPGRPSPSPIGSSSSATTPSPKTPLAMLAQNMNIGNGLLAHHKENALFPPHQLLPLLQGMLGLHNFTAFLNQPHHGVVAPQPRPAEPTSALAALHAAAAAAASPQAFAGLMAAASHAKLAAPQPMPTPVSLSGAAFSTVPAQQNRAPIVIQPFNQPPPQQPLDLSASALSSQGLTTDKRSDEERFQEMHGTLQAFTDHLMQCRGLEFDAKLNNLNLILGAWGVKRLNNNGGPLTRLEQR